jgi:hypothetical protein
MARTQVGDVWRQTDVMETAISPGPGPLSYYVKGHNSGRKTVVLYYTAVMARASSALM